MVSKEITIVNPQGLHLRPASQLCEAALEFRSKCTMMIGGKEYNLKSVLSVLSGQVTAQKEITLVCEGSDEQEALKTLSRILSAGKEN